MYNILLLRLDQTKKTQAGEPLPILNKYTIATAETEPEAYKKAQYYSALYQKKGLYHVIKKPSHIVTIERSTPQ